MNGSEDRQIGILTAKVEALEKKADKLESMMQEVRDTLVGAKGSWKVLVALGGLLMALTSIATGVVLKLWPGNG